MNRLTLLLAAACAAASFGASARVAWFEVAATDPSVQQSYLLPITDPDFAEEARELLRTGEAAGTIVVAQFAPGADGINRNLRDPDQPLWPWHVVQFLTFGNLTIELCDGSPQLVADDPQGFAENTGGQICFWGYSLVRELEEAPGIVPDAGFNGFWHSPGSEGTGFLLEVLPGKEQLALGWARYAPVGGAVPQQQWIFGIGTIAPDATGWATDVHLEQPPFPGAPGQPSPSDDTAVDVTLRFADCNHATLDVDDGLDTQLELVRSVPRASCSAPVDGGAQEAE